MEDWGNCSAIDPLTSMNTTLVLIPRNHPTTERVKIIQNKKEMMQPFNLSIYDFYTLNNSSQIKNEELQLALKCIFSLKLRDSM